MMNGYQRIRAALRGEWPDETPVMLHNFMMAARESGVPMSRYRSDPEEIARCFIEAVERYGYDGVVVDVDTATLAGAVGVPVAFPTDEPAICHGQRLRSLQEARALEAVDIGCYRGVQVWLEAVRLLRRHFGDAISIRGNCDQCPFSLAGAMRGAADWMMDLLEPANHEDALRLLEFCTDATIQFLRLMAAAGAHVLSNGDSPAGPSVVSPRIYRTFAQPYERRVVEAAHKLGLPYLLHICGKTELILEDMVSTGTDGLELDYKTDARRAHDLLRGRATFIGNLDPSGVLALGSAHDVERKTVELMEIFADTPRLILNAGCAIPAATPSENIRAMIAAARGRRVTRRRILLAAVCLLPRPATPRFQPTGGGEFEFETGELSGKLRAGGKSIGLRPVIHAAAKRDLTRSMGLASHYRVFTTNHRYGEGAWDWPSQARLEADGSVEVHWPAAEDRPFEMWAVYRWAGPATLDVETRVRAGADLPDFESFLAFYLAESFNNSMALVKNRGFQAATEAGGVWQMFPRDTQAVSLIQDGRWKIPPNPVDWKIQPELAQPIGLRRDTNSGITAIIMAPASDCFAISMPQQNEPHYSLYLSLFGRTIKAGENARARARLVITQGVREEEIADRLYRPYVEALH